MHECMKLNELMNCTLPFKSCSGNHGSKEMITIRSESVPSNILTISSPAPPHSPLLRLDNMNSSGIELSWDVVQQSREDQIAVIKAALLVE